MGVKDDEMIWTAQEQWERLMADLRKAEDAVHQDDDRDNRCYDSDCPHSKFKEAADAIEEMLRSEK